jgi:L-lactate dehydrogenase (cytochrome)/(S)-mandelate dehydrogenase
MRAETLAQRGFSIAEVRALSRRRLPRLVFDFVDGAADDEITLRRNEASFRDYGFIGRPLNGTKDRDQSLTLFGETLRSPVLIGPTGLSGLLWPRGETEAARAAAAAGTIYTMSHASTVSIEELAREVAGPLWLQVFIYYDRGLTRSFISRARAAGYKALVLTVDNQVGGWRERDLRNRFSIPPRWRPEHFLDIARHYGWALQRLAGPPLVMANYQLEGGSSALATGAKLVSLLDTTLSWADVEWIRREWDRPFLLKGVLHPDEARRAKAMGVDGLIVSNHGGRQLDGAPAALDVLPIVLDAFAGHGPVLIDGGVRRGSDVVKALALGAAACLIGRPHLWGLSVAGQAGVARVLEIYRADIDRTMALLGTQRLADIDRAILWRPGETARIRAE